MKRFENLPEPVDDLIHEGSEGTLSTGMVTAAFAERVELFRDLVLRLDLDRGFDFELSEDVEREGGTFSFGGINHGCDGFSPNVGYADSIDAHDCCVTRLEIDDVCDSVMPGAERPTLMRFLTSVEGAPLIISEPSIVELGLRTLLSRSGE